MLEAAEAKKCGKCGHIKTISDFPNKSRHCLQCKNKGDAKQNIKHKCPECGSEMRIRIRNKDQSQFLGCSKFPFCRGTRNI